MATSPRKYDLHTALALERIVLQHPPEAAVEYELEDAGLIVQDHRPYAHLTEEGKALLADHLKQPRPFGTLSPADYAALAEAVR